MIRTGTGGQLDFVIGAFWSKGGRAINLIPSTTMNDTVSRIVPYIAQGARVTVPRHYTGYVVTEYGAADLYGQVGTGKGGGADQDRPPEIPGRPGKGRPRAGIDKEKDFLVFEKEKKRHPPVDASLPFRCTS